MYAVDAVNPVIVILPLGLAQAVGLMELPVIEGLGLTRTLICALGPSHNVVELI